MCLLPGLCKKIRLEEKTENFLTLQQRHRCSPTAFLSFSCAFSTKNSQMNKKLFIKNTKGETQSKVQVDLFFSSFILSMSSLIDAHIFCCCLIIVNIRAFSSWLSSGLAMEDRAVLIVDVVLWLGH